MACSRWVLLPYKVKTPIHLDDVSLLKLARSGSDRAFYLLFEKYKSLVKLKTKSLYLKGAEKQDLLQEGLIGFFKAVRDYNGQKELPFEDFAEICITRQLISAIRTANRHKHRPLNSSLSISPCSAKIVSVSSRYFCFDPLELIIKREDKSLISELKKRLSPFERKVLVLYLAGGSYESMARVLSRSIKAIDNTVQRIRKKAKKLKTIGDREL